MLSNLNNFRNRSDSVQEAYQWQGAEELKPKINTDTSQQAVNSLARKLLELIFKV